MYESEVNRKVENTALIPNEVLGDFLAFREMIDKKSLLPWTEHCIECVWPTCYETCPLYSPREDGKCQRFEQGIVKIPLSNRPDEYLMKITFRKWGKLLSQGNTRLYNQDTIVHIERKDQTIANGINLVPLPKFLKKRIVQKRYGHKNRWASKESTHNLNNDTFFVIECFNPLEFEVTSTLLMRPEGKNAHLPFQKLLQFSPGYNRILVPSRDISTDISQDFKIEITPNHTDGVTLIFGVIDFMKFKSAEQAKIKCIIWDLDNTIWHGVLVEDGAENLQLRNGLKETIITLDQSGILQSIASKNDYESAMNVLKAHGLEEYFLYSQINWGPKSQSINAIVQKLNIGMNSILFVDDQKFEREEAKTAHTDLRVLDPNELNSIKDILNFIEKKDTSESRNRRKLYKEEIVRQTVQSSFDGQYFDFLKSCEIVLNIGNVTEDNVERVHELLQRTNQMNFSGHRYSKSELSSMIESKEYDFHVLQVKDKFGDYGIVGLGIFEVESNTLIDLTFSCRIQSKRIEHAYLNWLLTKKQESYPRVVYNKTKKNEPSGRVFDDLGFVQEKSLDNSDQLLTYPPDKAPIDENIITIK